MTKPEIEMLADDYVKQRGYDGTEEGISMHLSFSDGCLKGVEDERKRCLKIAKKAIQNYSFVEENKGAMFHMAKTVEQIERGDK